jgi:nicotinate-nucleotide adenylyltransferase
VIVVPAARNPRRSPIEGPTPEQRMEMLRIGLSELSYAEIDDQELRRGGLSYSVQTIENYAATVSPEGLFLIVGADQFDEFDKWKDFERILELANLAVIARPGVEPPFSADDMPEGLRALVAEFDRGFAQLATGRHIEFLRVAGVDVSATDVRKRLRSSRGVERSLTIPVEEYLRAQGLYGPLGPRIGDFEEFTRFCAGVLFERKAVAVRGFDLRGLEAASDFTLVASGTSTRHAGALAERVLHAVKEEFNVHPQSAEGLSEGRWALLDYGALIVHVFYDFVRQEYRIEDLWKNGRDLKLADQGPGGAVVKKP